VPDILIQTLNSDDFAAWEPLWQGYLTFYKSQISDDTTATTFQRLTGGSEPMGGFLARDAAGCAIGLVHWIDHRSCWTIGNYCYLQDLFVAPDVRGNGAGRLLIAVVADAARKRGCSRVHWLTQHDNETAMHLYDRLATRSGFIQYKMKF
jgi:GNAT superfamily N-acetyltransferase